jgi:two-component system, LytTR family, response regulator
VSIRVLVVDDEQWARRRMVALLASRPDVEVIGECAGGAEAVLAIQDLSPDLVFLDVQMPDLDGFEVLHAIDPAHLPLVVFATAYDDYAVRAFEAHALDYLLKPFGERRLQETVDRAGRDLERSRAAQRLSSLIRGLAQDGRYLRRLVVKAGARIVFLRTGEVDWFEAAANYVCLHCHGREYLVRGTIASLEGRLDPDRFLRVHRSIIVNLDRVRELPAGARGEAALTLADGTSLPVGRRFRSRLARLSLRCDVEHH